MSRPNLRNDLSAKDMKVFPRRLVLPVLAVSVLLGCNPFNDMDGIVMNVNDHAFAGPEMSVVSFNLFHGFGDAVNDATLDHRLEVVAGGILVVGVRPCRGTGYVQTVRVLTG